MSKRLGLLLLATLLVAGAAGGWFLLATPAAPVLGINTLVNLGEQEQGVSIDVPMPVRNLGSAPLVLREFRSSCACSVVEIDVHGQRRAVRTLTVPPGTEVALRFRVSVRGDAGLPMREVLYLLTNDPRQPEVRVDFIIDRVLGGYLSVPKTVVLGSISEGTVTSRTIKIYDSGQVTRRLKAAMSSHPATLVVGMVTHLDPEQTPQAERNFGRQVALVQFDFRATAIGPQRGVLHIVMEDGKQQPLLVPVEGNVVPRFEVRPKLVTLPRRAGQAWLAEAEVEVAASDGRSFRLEFPRATAGLEVEPGMPGNHNATVHLVSVRWRSPPQNAMSRSLRLTATRDGESFPVEIEVRWQRMEEDDDAKANPSPGLQSPRATDRPGDR